MNFLGIDNLNQRMRIDLESYRRPLNNPYITSDIDSVNYLSDDIPTTEDLSWTMFPSPDDNINTNIHMYILVNGVHQRLNYIPNMYIGRFGPNSIYTVHMFFPGMSEKVNGKWVNQVPEDLRRYFYNKIFFPSLQRTLSPTDWGHIPIMDYDQERKRGTDYRGYLRKAQIFISNIHLQNLILEIKQYCSLAPLSFASPLYLISAKNTKLLTRSTVVETTSALSSKLYGLDMSKINKSNLLVDLGFEIFPDDNYEVEPYTLVWKASKIKVNICMNFLFLYNIIS